MLSSLVEGEVLFLDEPLEGLDPRQRVRMIELFRRLGAEGRTVVVSSHVLDEVERFGSRVLVIAQGRLAAEGRVPAWPGGARRNRTVRPRSGP